MAYGRYRLLKQIKKIENEGYKVIYAHTDSIITDAPKELFDLGTDIGQWKHEEHTEKGVIIKSIAQKHFIK